MLFRSGVEWKSHKYSDMETGKGELLLEGTEVAVICAGPVANRAVEAALNLKEETGWNPSVYNIRYVKPLDAELLADACEKHDRLITIEDGTLVGGLYGAVSESVASMNKNLQVRGVGIPDQYISQGTQLELRAECNLTTEAIFDIFVAESEKISKKD